MIWQLLVVAELRDLFQSPPPCAVPLTRPRVTGVEEEWKMERGREGGSVSNGEKEEKDKGEARGFIVYQCSGSS